jgi:hypothetical protein
MVNERRRDRRATLERTTRRLAPAELSDEHLWLRCCGVGSRQDRGRIDLLKRGWYQLRESSVPSAYRSPMPEIWQEVIVPLIQFSPTCHRTRRARACKSSRLERALCPSLCFPPAKAIFSRHVGAALRAGSPTYSAPSGMADVQEWMTAERPLCSMPNDGKVAGVASRGLHAPASTRSPSSDPARWPLSLVRQSNARRR